MKKRRSKKPSDSWRNWLTQESCFAQFKNRLIAKLEECHPQMKNRVQIDRRFALLCGHPVPAGLIDDAIYQLRSEFELLCVKEVVQSAGAFPDLCFAIECLFTAVEEYDSPSLLRLEEAIREAVVLSPGIAIDISSHGKEITFRPAGDLLLDKSTVDEVLSSLGEHPTISKNFQEALRIYASGETAKYRNALDNLRFALEALLKKTLGNRKSLEHQRSALLPWLKERGLHQQVVNMYEGLLFGPYAGYQNQAVKHNEEYSLVEVEFMIYLTGTFMRLLLVLSRKGKA